MGTNYYLIKRENNKELQNLYKKYNFREVGLRKKYYDNKDDAILMSLNL